MNGFVVREFCDGRISFIQDCALGGDLWTSLKNREEKDFGFRTFGLYALYDSRDPLSDFLGGVVPSVVLTNHDDGKLGFNAVEIPVINAPEDVLGAIATDT